MRFFWVEMIRFREKCWKTVKLFNINAYHNYFWNKKLQANGLTIKILLENIVWFR